MDRRQFLGRVSALAGGILLPYFPGFARANYLYLPHRRKAFRETGPYVSNGSLLDCGCLNSGGTLEYLDQWSDISTGPATVTYAANAPGADPMTTTWLFDTNGSAAGDDNASITADTGSVEGLGNTVVVSCKLYHDLIGTSSEDFFAVEVRRSDWEFYALFASDGIKIYDSASFVEVGTDLVVQDTWQAWTFVIDLSSGVGSATCDVYLDNVLKASSVDCDQEGSFTDGDVILRQYGHTVDDLITYTDYLKIGNGLA